MTFNDLGNFKGHILPNTDNYGILDDNAQPMYIFAAKAPQVFLTLINKRLSTCNSDNWGLLFFTFRSIYEMAIVIMIKYYISSKYYKVIKLKIEEMRNTD